MVEISNTYNFEIKCYLYIRIYIHIYNNQISQPFMFLFDIYSIIVSNNVSIYVISKSIIVVI